VAIDKSDLLTPGFMGHCDSEDNELEIIKDALRTHWRTRVKWGFGKRTRKFPRYLIERVACYGHPDSAKFNRRLVRGSQAWAERSWRSR